MDGARAPPFGVERQGFRLSLSHIAAGEWRAIFRGDNVLLAPVGFRVAATPWRAVWPPMRPSAPQTTTW